MKTKSWVIVETKTKAVIFETFEAKTINALNKKKYSAIPILEYLQTLNK
jgi:hypothetical protein